MEKRAAGTRASHKEAVNRRERTNRKPSLCTHHIPEQEVNIYTNCHQTPDSFTSFQAIQRNLQRSQRFSPHQSQFSRVQRTERQPEPAHPITRRGPPPSDRAGGNVNDGEKTSASRDAGGGGTMLPFVAGAASDRRTSGVSRSHSQHSPPKHNKKLYSAHQRGGGTEGGALFRSLMSQK